MQKLIAVTLSRRKTGKDRMDLLHFVNITIYFDVFFEFWRLVSCIFK